jgi:antitoxin MazE
MLFDLCYNIVHMRKNLTVVGNSLGIIIEKPILDLLGISKETQLEMITDGKRLILEPVREEDRIGKIKGATKRVMKNHDKTLRELAK